MPKTMHDIGTTTIDTGTKALRELIASVDEHLTDWNEAETRFHVIDQFIERCLGWPREAFRLEVSLGRTYSDYELGKPRRVIWEAKREGRTFELPANPDRKLVVDLASILALGGEAAEAIKQVQGYCASRGVELAVATNGHQLIAFLATRSDGTPPLEGNCLVLDGLDRLLNDFPQVWQCLSPAGVSERRLHRLLTVGSDKALPAKLSGSLLHYPKFRNPTDLHTSLRTISELLLIDAVDQEETEREFYHQCYCESGPLSQHALVSKQMLASRYSSLFDPSEAAPQVSPVNLGPHKAVLTPEVMAEAVSLRPIVLIGDVGVGKTSFLKHLMYVSAFDEFKKAIYIYIDLGSKGALSNDLTKFVTDEIQSQLREKYGFDVDEFSFVQKVYSKDIVRFERGIHGQLKETNPTLYAEKYSQFLEGMLLPRDRHLRDSVAYLSGSTKKQVIIVIDNADQREYETQQRAFIISQNLAKDWKAAVFIAVRPQTFYKSKESGALTAYPHRVFTIAPPRVDHVIEKRLNFALKMAEGRVRVQKLRDVGLNLRNIAIFLKALLLSLRNSRDLVEFLSNITGGNIRAVIDLVTKFIGAPNVDVRNIIDIMEREGTYVVPVHEFWKASLLGDFSYYDPASSIALNLFDIHTANLQEHFLIPMILGYLFYDGTHRSKEGFVTTESVIAEMQEWGFPISVTENALRRTNNKKLIETSQRVTFDENDTSPDHGVPANFRITTVGAYHLKRWMSDFAYVDAMLFDTPILDRETRDALLTKLDSPAIFDRYERAMIFRRYLSQAWHASNLHPPYFDWEDTVATGQGSFDRVSKAIARAELKASFAHPR